MEANLKSSISLWTLVCFCIPPRRQYFACPTRGSIWTLRGTDCVESAESFSSVDSVCLWCVICDVCVCVWHSRGCYWTARMLDNDSFISGPPGAPQGPSDQSAPCLAPWPCSLSVGPPTPSPARTLNWPVLLIQGRIHRHKDADALFMHSGI